MRKTHRIALVGTLAQGVTPTDLLVNVLHTLHPRSLVEPIRVTPLAGGMVEVMLSCDPGVGRAEVNDVARRIDSTTGTTGHDVQVRYAAE